MNADKEKHDLEEQFQALHEKAKNEYPDIDDAISLMDNVACQTSQINEYFQLIDLAPEETTNNHVTFE